MKMHIPWSLILLNLQNKAEAGEKQALADWIKDSELHQLIYDEIMADQHFMALLTEGRWTDTSREWERLLERIQPKIRMITIRRRSLITAVAAAASLLLLLGSGILYFYLSLNTLLHEQGTTYIYSPRGQRTHVKLPDSSSVWLNGGSSISYAVDFNRHLREVTAEGEVFFEVKRNPEKAFHVIANEIKVKVYGTSFNVKAFADEKQIETTLISGSLSVVALKEDGSEGSEVFLQPNEKFIFLRDSKYVEGMTSPAGQDARAMQQQATKDVLVPAKLQKNINTEKEKLWKDGKLVFRDETFAELAIRLERWYDVKIHFEDKNIRNYKFTGVFEKETINQAMDALMLSSQQSYQHEIVFRDIYLRKK
jgi:transmembrane sensor